MSRKLRICFMSKPRSKGGPSTFQKNFEEFLKKESIEVIYPEDNIKPDLIFIISGTRRLFWLFSKKISGVKILQRLDGMNWKYNDKSISFPETIKQKIQNLTIAFIRRFLADHVVYQSKFIERWWNEKYGIHRNNSVIINGTSLSEEFERESFQSDKIIITCIEGNIQNDQVTISSLNYLNEVVSKNPKIDKIEIYGDSSLIENIKKNFKNISFEGHIPRENVKKMLISNKRIFFLLELNPPCPNSMIEAISAGLPCIGFDTGSFKELLSGAGRTINYNANVWRLEIPDFSAINDEINEVINRYDFYRSVAFEVSKKYDIHQMLSNYFSVVKKLAL